MRLRSTHSPMTSLGEAVFSAPSEGTTRQDVRPMSHAVVFE
jgi:hypothetical protein